MSARRLTNVLGVRSTRIDDATERAGGWRELMAAEPEAQAAYGVTPSEIEKLRATRAIAEEWNSPDDQAPRWATPEDCARYLMPRFGSEPVESFGVALINTRNRLKRCVVVSRGSVNGAIVHPREVFRPAIVERAAAVVLFHNHPSGDPQPSQEDRQLTKRLLDAGRIIGIGVLDHVIVAAGAYFSFKERGEL